MESPTTIAPFLAFLHAQRSFSAALKDSANPYFKSKYADLSSVWGAAHEALHANGLTVMQPIRINEAGQTVVITNVRYQNGELIETSECPVLCKSPNDPQAMGSAITYARRYSLAAILGIVTTDDDGEAAMSRTVTTKEDTKAKETTYYAPEPPSSHDEETLLTWQDSINGLVDVADLNRCKKEIATAKLGDALFPKVWGKLTKRAKQIGATYDTTKKVFTT